MLADQYRDTATVSRGTVTGNKTLFEEVGSFACHIQPVTDTHGVAEAGRGGRVFRMFSTSAVLIGDRITDQNDAKYEAYGVKKQTFRGKTHYETSLRGV